MYILVWDNRNQTCHQCNANGSVLFIFQTIGIIGLTGFPLDNCARMKSHVMAERLRAPD